MTKQESEHITNVKLFPCGNCDVPGSSEAHHLIENGTRVSHYATIPLCPSCHRGNNGIHGDKRLWLIMKNTELKVLADTIKKLNEV